MGPPDEPTSPAPASLVRNSTWLMASRLYGVAVSGAISILAVRTFSTTSYADFALAIAFITFAAMVSELGIATLAIRRMIEDPAQARPILSVALVAEAATSLAALAVIVPLLVLLDYDAAVITVAAVGAGLVLTQGLLAALEAPFQAVRTFAYVAASAAAQHTVLLLAGGAALLLGAGPAQLVAAMVLAATVATVVAFALARAKLGLRPHASRAVRAGVRPFLVAAIPIGLTGAITTLYDRIGLIMVSQFDDKVAVAHYSVPLMLLFNIYVIPGVIASAFFPLLSAQLRDDAAAAANAFRLLLRIFVVGSGAIAIVLALGARDILTLLFGERYADSAGALQILAAVVVLSFLNYLLWYGLLAGGLERSKALIMAVGVAVSVGLNVLLIPAHGIEGAAIALLISDALVVGAQIVIVQRRMLTLPWRMLATPAALAAAAVAPFAAGVLAPGLAWGVLAAVAWIAGLHVLRYVTPLEWEPLVAPVRQRFNR